MALPAQLRHPCLGTVVDGDGRPLAMAAVTLVRTPGRWLDHRLHAHVALEQTGRPDEGVLGIELVHGDATAVIARTAVTHLEVSVETPAACFVPFRVAASRGSEGDLLAAAIDLA